MSEQILCEKCGTQMIPLLEYGSVGMTCPNCGWGWATTSSDPTADDDTEYEIWVCPGNSQSPAVLRLIADIANVNLLQAKKMLGSQEPVMLYKACNEAAAALNKVQKILVIAGRLKSAKVEFFITPDFKYEI